MAGLVNLDVGGIFKGVNETIGKMIPDKDLAKKIEGELQKAQLSVNAVEASHTSLFVSGWRPYIGWVCGISLSYNLVIQPVLSNWFELISMETSTLENILMGMLGLGGARTIEKIVGVARGSIKTPNKKPKKTFNSFFKRRRKR